MPPLTRDEMIAEIEAGRGVVIGCVRRVVTDVDDLPAEEDLDCDALPDEGGGAPTDATYVTNTPSASLDSEQALSLLDTGYAKVTTTTGEVSSVPTIPDNDVAVDPAGLANTDGTDLEEVISDFDAAITAATGSGGPPTGSAGGVLSGTYPNPGFAADMATQAELDAHINNATDAHDASAISILDTAENFNSENVEDVILELRDYADQVAAGFTPKIPLRLISAAALPANTYDNGAAGVGATLTADANGALSVDGVAVAINDRVGAKDEVDQTHNGAFIVTDPGSAGTPYVLTRLTDSDEGHELFNAIYGVREGTNAGRFYYVSNTAEPVLGTDNITFAQFTPVSSGGSGGIQATAPLSKSGNNMGFGALNSVTAKTTLVDADNMVISDSAAAHVPKKITVANVAAAFWARIAALTGKTTPVDADTMVLSDSAASNAGKSVTWANVKATLKTYNDTLYQPLDAELTAIAGLTSAADKGIQFTGSGTAAVYDLTTAGKALLDDASAKAQRATLLIAKGADVASANNLALGADGLVFHITGTTQINLIADTNFNAGDTIVLIFDGACLVKHNQTVSGANKPILLMGDVDWTTAANDVLALTYDGTSWYDTRRGLLSQMGVIPINDQSGTTYAPVLSDRGKLIICTNASAITVTIPANASVAFPIGTVFQIQQGGLGQVTVAITSDTLNAPNGAKTALQYSIVSLTKTAATAWTIAGDTTA